MDVHRWPDAAAFLARAEQLLLADQARHTLAFGIAVVMEEPSGHRSTGEQVFATIEAGGEVVGVAVRQPPYGLVLSPSAAEAGRGVWPWITSLARMIRATCPDLPGAQGPPALVRAFGAEWERLGGPPGRPKMSMRIHALEAVRPLPAVPGRLRRATVADRDPVIAWLEAMRDEALPHDPPVDPDWVVRVRLADQGDPLRGLYLWVTPNGEPRALCGASGPTPNAVRINAVYTPPEHRRRGYATAAVAELSRRLLATGRRCVLFTDLSNPTSNRIYAAIGYEPVCEVDEIRFS